MKKLVPFTKEIEFKTMISKVTSISLEHTLRVEEGNLISGYFILEGTYKMTQASQIDEEFSYKIPVEIELDEKYDVSNIILDIDDFTYEVIDEEKMGLNITLCIDNIEEKEIIPPVEEVINVFDIKEENELTRENTKEEVLDDLFLDTSEEIPLEIEKIESNPSKEEKEQSQEVLNNINSVDTPIKETSSVIDSNANSIFSSFKDNTETYKTYSVYVMKEEDTIEVILQKYGVTKEELEEYNDLSSMNVGSKIIVPSSYKNE